MKDKEVKNRSILDIFILLLVTCFLCIPLLNSKIDIYTDDGIQHIARAYGTVSSIKQDGIFGNVISSFANGFGYSWNFFYGPLSTICIIVINLIFKNYIISYKVLCFIVFLLSGYYMYKFIQNLVSNNNISLLAGILYLSFPYHLTDLYIRNALGEFMSFLFLPLVFLGLYNLFYTSTKHYYFIIGMTGLILTHNISAVITAFFALLYVGMNFEKLSTSNVKRALIIDSLFIMLVTSFYWLPLLEAKMLTHYQVYEPGMMSTLDSFVSHGLKLNQLFVSKQDGSYVFELGPHIIIMLGLSVMGIRLMKDEIKETYVFCLLSGILCLWMTTKYFPWRLFPEEMSIIQFPWRIMMMSAFFLSIVCALNTYVLIKKFNAKDLFVISSIAVLYTLAFTGYIRYNENIADINNYDLGRVSGKDNEVIIGMGKGEYLPKKAFEDRFYIATRDEYIDIIDGDTCLIQNEIKDGSHYEADLKGGESDYSVLELPYIYYPGYEIRQDGMIVKPIQTKHGFLGTVILKKDNAKLEVNYTGTKIMHISALVSIVSAIGLCVYIWKKH